MATKLSWTELRRALAARAEISEKEANLFLTTFNAQIVEALKQDKQVKINGLGTFKLQSVAARKSVNVSSGEEITIDSYNKIAFTPEVGVKELVEKTMESPSTAAIVPNVEDIDPLQKLGEQAAEIVDLLADLGQSPYQEEPVVAEPVVTEPVVEEPVVAEPVVTEPVVAEPVVTEPVVTEPMVTEPVVEEPVVTEPVVEEPVVAEPVVTEPVVAEPVVTEPVVEEPVVAEPIVKPTVEKPKKKYHFVRDTLICVACIVLILGIGYFFLRHQLHEWIDSRIDQHSPSPAQVVVPTDSIASESDIVMTDTVTEPIASVDTTTIDVLYQELITIEPMREASRLTWMSKRYYGEKIYWVYLYDANKDHIVNPNNIEVGTPIRVPHLTPEQLDTTLESTRATLLRLREQAEAACRN